MAFVEEGLPGLWLRRLVLVKPVVVFVIKAIFTVFGADLYSSHVILETPAAADDGQTHSTAQDEQTPAAAEDEHLLARPDEKVHPHQINQLTLRIVPEHPAMVYSLVCGH